MNQSALCRSRDVRIAANYIEYSSSAFSCLRNIETSDQNLARQSRSRNRLDLLVQQQAVVKRKRPRPSLNSLDRLFLSAAHIAALVGCSVHGETGDRGRMASGRRLLYRAHADLPSPILLPS